MIIAPRDDLFRQAAQFALDLHQERKGIPFSWALSGGSTPQIFYRFLLKQNLLPREMIPSVRWFTSDERCVPLSSVESNFGNLDRNLLAALNPLEEAKFPWPTDLSPNEAAAIYEKFILNLHGPGHSFDLCFLGMGDDGHTASIFPDSPLLHQSTGNLFASVDVPGKGIRLTITPEGLSQCRRIVLLVTGANKAVTLKAVIDGLRQPLLYPVQIVADFADKVVWLVDPEAAASL